MNTLTDQNSWFWGTLVIVILAVQSGCQEDPPIESWHSPRMSAIKKEWDALDRSFSSKSTDEYAEHLKSLDAILRKHLSNRDLRYLVATSGSLPIHAKDRSDFVNAVLKYMTETYLLAGNRDELVMLLSTRFPDQIFWEKPIEYAVVTGHGSGRLKEPILMFGEAYAKCRDPDTKHHLAVVVRRAFIGSGIRGTDDAEFITNAMHWYEKEKDHLTVANYYYLEHMSYDEFPEAYDEDRSASVGRGSAWRRSAWRGCEKHPLFIGKGKKKGPSPIGNTKG